MRLVLAVGALLCAGFAQEPTSSTSSTITALRLSTFGNSDPKVLRDYTATGTMTMHDANQVGTVTIKSLRLHYLRCESSVSGISRTWVLRGLRAYSQTAQRKPIPLNSDVSVSLRSFALPVAQLLNARNDHIVESPEPRTLTLRQANIASHFEFSADTHLIAAARASVVARAGSGAVQREFRYSDYRPVNGIRFPFAIEEWLDGKLVMTIHIEQIQLNTGLTADDFKLEGLPEGRERQQ